MTHQFIFNVSRVSILGIGALVLGACGNESPSKQHAGAPVRTPAADVQATPTAPEPGDLVSGAVRDGIAIRSPRSGLTVSPGESFNVVIEPRNGFVPRRIMVGWKFDSAELEQAPYAATLKVPDNAVGRFEVYAMAMDADKRVSYAPSIQINVSPRATLTGLVFEPADGYVFDLGTPTQIFVFGVYNDGVTRRLEGTTIPVQYSSDDQRIASVNAKGQVTGVAEGDVTIRARVGRLETTTTMHVHAESVATVP